MALSTPGTSPCRHLVRMAVPGHHFPGRARLSPRDAESAGQMLDHSEGALARQEDLTGRRNNGSVDFVPLRRCRGSVVDALERLFQ